MLMAVNKESCEYVFEWSTYLVCEQSAPEINSDCKYTDDRTKITYDMSALSSDEAYAVCRLAINF